MLPGEVGRPEIIRSVTGLSPLGRMEVPYIYPSVLGASIREGVLRRIGRKGLCIMLTGK
ncbi:hypothetical protein GCM10018780_08490 [Streptomyces lanatus]|nr:hypothetical protein GCM10018780_08490 [Streptomyces lanatus]